MSDVKREGLSLSIQLHEDSSEAMIHLTARVSKVS